MPCDSTIRTSLKDKAMLDRALARVPEHVRAGLTVTEAKSGEWTLTGAPSAVNAVTQEYAAVGVEQWAEENGWTIARDEAGEYTLTQWES